MRCGRCSNLSGKPAVGAWRNERQGMYAYSNNYTTYNWIRFVRGTMVLNVVIRFSEYCRDFRMFLVSVTCNTHTHSSGHIFEQESIVQMSEMNMF